MASSVQRTILTNQTVEIVLGDAPEMAEATLWIQVKIAREIDRGLPLAVLQAIALRDARNLLSEQIQATTRTHGPVPE
ncbi:hypothetical protein [Acidocella sp.]|uniref:hypothetical protein n=1 Tax=Acidocella sp. TaxID=50710 RepID=UPI00260FA9F3|nr:hypothetical protein [Acidocella sp.]